MNGSLLIYCHK